MNKYIKQVRFKREETNLMIQKYLFMIEDIFKVEENQIRRPEKYFSSFI
jgi:hypothetical protein